MAYQIEKLSVCKVEKNQLSERMSHYLKLWSDYGGSCHNNEHEFFIKATSLDDYINYQKDKNIGFTSELMTLKEATKDFEYILIV